MACSRSRERDRDRDRDRDKRRKEDKEKDKQKRSRSRDRRKAEKDRDRAEKKRSRSREKAKKPPKEEERPERQERQRSPSVQYRVWRFDSPPKEEEYQRDAMLTGNPMGIGGVAAALQGGLALAGVSNSVNPLSLAADTKAMRELYVGNLPAGITAPQLMQFLNQVSQAVKVNSLPGEPVLSATMGGGGLFAFVEFRTAEEAANGLRLNGVELLGCQLKVGRPKGYSGPESAGGGQLALPGISSGQLALPSSGGGAPSLGEMMAQHGAIRPGQLALPGLPNAASQAAMVSAIDHRLCLVNVPTFVTEDRIRELLITFGQLKFFALQKDEEGKSVGVAFFEYADMMTQQQARAALEGLELGAKRLSVKKPEEVIEMGLVSRVQKLGQRVVPSKILYLKNIVTPDDLRDEAGYQEICADIRLEGEKFGAVVSMEVPRSRGGGLPGQPGAPSGMPALAGAVPAVPAGGVFALEDTKPEGVAPAGSLPKAMPPRPPMPDMSLALVPAGAAPIVPVPPAIPGAPGVGGVPQSEPFDPNVPGLGYAFIEFATIEGASKAKKALSGRRFGANLVEAEYFSESRYHAKDFGRPTPNTDEPKQEPGTELALVQSNSGGQGTLDEAPVMVE